MVFLICPLVTEDVGAVLDWFEARGVAMPKIFRGPDGNLRASALVRAA